MSEVMLNKEKKYIPGVYENPSNYEKIKVYIVISDDYDDGSIYGIFLDKRKAELYAKIHDCVVEEFETMDEEEIVFGLSLSPSESCTLYNKIHSGRIRNERTDPVNL